MSELGLHGHMSYKTTAQTKCSIFLFCVWFLSIGKNGKVGSKSRLSTPFRFAMQTVPQNPQFMAQEQINKAMTPEHDIPGKSQEVSRERWSPTPLSAWAQGSTLYWLSDPTCLVSPEITPRADTGCKHQRWLWYNLWADGEVKLGLQAGFLLKMAAVPCPLSWGLKWTSELCDTCPLRGTLHLHLSKVGRLFLKQQTSEQGHLPLLERHPRWV